MSAPRCAVCLDTGSRDKSGDYLDCTDCEAASMRAALNEWSSKLPLMDPTDYRWAIHQRALAMAPKQEAPKVIDVLGAFEEWAKEHLGQGYSLETEEHTYVNPVTRWAFAAFKAGRAAPAAANGALTDEQILMHAVPVFGEQDDRNVRNGELIAYARAILAAAGPDAALVALIHKAQMILAHHLPPDGPDAKTTISELLGLLDGPESRAALKPHGDV